MRSPKESGRPSAAHRRDGPLFEGLGTPSADKKHVLYPGGHEIFVTQRSRIVQESWDGSTATSAGVQ